MTNKCDNIYDKIKKNYKQISSMRPIPQDSFQRFVNDFSISATHNSTAIEGNTFTFDETLLLLKEGVVSSAHSMNEHNEIVGYKKAFDYLFRAIKGREEITEDFVKKIHSYVLYGKESAGEYRDIQVYVGNMFDVKYTPPAPERLSELMSEYIDNINLELEGLFEVRDGQKDFETIFHTLAKHHIEFERIHPFVDGNGRIGRLLLTYEMILLGLLPVDIRYEEKERYYAGIKNYESKSKYSTREDSKTEALANLLAEYELKSMEVYLNMFSKYLKPEAEM